MSRQPLVLRWQMGAAASWDALELSVKLMQRLEPDAAYHVVHQGEIKRQLAGVVWHAQSLPEGEPYCSGRHMPEKLVRDVQEIYMDNDHIMWRLPPGWLMFRLYGAPDSVLIWQADWKYYGNWPLAPDAPCDISAGMWGVGTALTMPSPIYRVAELGGEYNQDEYGWVCRWLSQQRERHVVTQEEVPIYCPDHNALLGRDRIGSHGVHINGLNRGWNPKGEILLNELRSRYL